jgi:hypothetical protein
MIDISGKTVEKAEVIETTGVNWFRGWINNEPTWHMIEYPQKVRIHFTDGTSISITAVIESDHRCENETGTLEIEEDK